MATFSERLMSLDTMLIQIEQVLKQGKESQIPAYTVVLGAGASSGAVPTAKQMLGIPEKGIVHPQCIPAWLGNLDAKTVTDPEKLANCVHEFWACFREQNKGIVLDANGLPNSAFVADAYQAVFSKSRTGGLNSSKRARDYIREITMPENARIKLNGTHFYLASLLSLQNRSTDVGYGGKPLYIGKRPFARTIFTTNFDPLLQISLQLFGLLYYMTDRPENLAPDVLSTDDHSAPHLFYAHGSVHRQFLANTEDDINHLESNARALVPYLSNHGVIVLGYNGWDDCLLNALNKITNFDCNVYWLVRGESSISPRVRDFLCSHPGAYWVQIRDGGEFMAELHQRLCPGMRYGELLSNPIRFMRSRLENIDFSDIPSPVPMKNPPDEKPPIRASALHQQVIDLLKVAEKCFGNPSVQENPAEELLQLEHEADSAYANDEWEATEVACKKVIEHYAATPAEIAKALIHRGYSRAIRGMIEEAIADYGRVIELPDAPVDSIARAFLSRGHCYGQQDKLQEAIIDYTQVIELSGAPVASIVTALLKRGVCYFEQGKHEEQIADYTQVIDLSGAPIEEVATALNLRGGWYGQEGCQEEKAIADYTRLIKLPTMPVDRVADALRSRGYYYVKQEKLQEAVADYTSLIDLPGAPVERVAEAILSRGHCYVKQGKLREAVADYTRVVELSGAPVESTANALVNRGHCFVQQGKDEEAISDYTQTIELAGGTVDPVVQALTKRSVFYAKQGKHEEAIADCTRVIGLSGVPVERAATALLIRALCHRQMGNIEAAITDYASLIGLHAAPVELVARGLSSRAQVYFEQDDFEHELADWTSVIELPGVPVELLSKALSMRSLCYGQQGRSEEELADYARVIELPCAPVEHVANALVYRGDYYKRQGKTEEAGRDLMRVLALEHAPVEVIEKAREALNKINA